MMKNFLEIFVELLSLSFFFRQYKKDLSFHYKVCLSKQETSDKPWTKNSNLHVTVSQTKDSDFRVSVERLIVQDEC